MQHTFPVSQERCLYNKKLRPNRAKPYRLRGVPSRPHILVEGRLAEGFLGMNPSQREPSHALIDLRISLIYHQIIKVFIFQVELFHEISKVRRSVRAAASAGA